MPFAVLLLMLRLAAQGGEAVEPAHQRNPIYVELLRAGFRIDGGTVALPEPTLRDGLDAGRQRAALREVCGSAQALENLLRDSVTAPFVLKIRDQKTADATVRMVDLWFVLRADLAGLDPTELAGKASGKSAEAGNMRFENRLIGEDELKPHGRSRQRGQDLSRWYSQIKCRLLDRIEIESIDESVATRAADSIVIASHTDLAFDKGDSLVNRWRGIEQDARAGPWHPFRGGLSYAKISRLRHPTGAILVELHGAFAEPDPWFQGAPILRSKFAPVAQDQIRRLRRELLKNRKPAARPASENS
jgi:hypothetical protein